MNINIKNYEEFFLLYADNELTDVQKQIVEMFVKSNPLLKKDFDDILSTVQSPESISYTDKSFLFKNPLESFIDLNNCEKRFVEYHDGALNEEKRSFTETFLSENEEFKEAFELIGKARLEADLDIMYPGKEDLYRHVAKVRYFSFMKMAVAAAVLVFIVWFGRSYFTGQESNPAPMATVLPANTLQDSPVTSPVKINSDLDQKPSTEIADVKEKVIIKEEKQEPIVQYATKLPVKEHSDITVQPKTIKPSENVVQNDIEIKRPELKNALNIKPELPQHEIKEMTAMAAHVDTDVTPMPEKQPELTYASFGAEPSNEYVFFDIPAENLRRSKVGIFIKKVKRTIDRNNPINRLFNGEDVE